MKLNQECVRQVLLFTETLPPQGTRDTNIFGSEYLADFSKDDVIYTIQKLNEAGYLNAKITYASDVVYWTFISSITWDGHVFLDNIRDDGVWKDTKEKCSSVASVSLPILAQIAWETMKFKLGIS